MSREILFKAKCKDNGEWVEGDLIKLSGMTFISTKKDFVLAGLGYYYDLEKWELNKTLYEVRPETVCQYTGLTDKNGKKIFEGDILKRMIYTGKVEYEYCTAKWVNDLGLWGFVVDGQEDYCIGQELYRVAKECEVIGSIHDKEEVEQ